MIVEEYIEEENQRQTLKGIKPYLILLSAKNEERLKVYADNLLKFIKNKTSIGLEDLAYTLQVGREAMEVRLGLVVYSIEELEERLSNFLNGHDAIENLYYGQVKRNKELISLFTENEELQEAIKNLLWRKKLPQLLELWVKGLPFDWDKLYDGVKPCRISLPTYPFEPRSFWYLEQETNQLDQSFKSVVPTKDIQEHNIKSLKESLSQDRSLAVMRADLVAVIKDVLLLREEDAVDEESTFLDLGLDSISVVRFIQKLAEKLQLPLRETLVFDYPTIDALAKYIVQQNYSMIQSQPRQVTATMQVSNEQTIDSPQWKEHLGRFVKRYEEVIPLQMEGDGPLLFCIHPVSGDVGLYAKLADAAQRRFRIIGIKSQGFLTSKNLRSTIEEMGDQYAKIITEIDPKGPYHLFGASMGGTVAYECVRHLQLQNRTVHTLLFGESPLIENQQDARLWDADEMQNLIMNANFLMIAMLHIDPEFRQRKAEGKIRWSELEITHNEIKDIVETMLVEELVELIRRRGVRQSQAVLVQRLESMAKTHLINLRSLVRYRPYPLPNPFDLNAVLLRTETAKATSPEVYNPDYLIRVQQAKGSLAYFMEGWKKLLPQLETCVIEGENHFELLNVQIALQPMSDVIAKSMGIEWKQDCSDCAKEISRQVSYGYEIEKKIAIVGMSGQFPGAKTPDALWQLLKNGQSAFTEFPQNRDWDIRKIYDKVQRPNKTYTRRGGFLEDIDKFDPVFFQIPPKEAELMDPAERFFLQESWKAIEDAGIDPTSLSGKPWGVFCGSGGDYTLRLKEISGMSLHVTTSNIPGRVAYSLNLTGPCLSVDAGCASSLLAIAQACDHLILGKCDAAIAGGVLIYTTPNLIITSCQYQLFSQDERCSAFAAQANGMMPSEAVGVLVLKSLAKAIADGDRIYGVIEGWGNNHNGKTNGIASPSVAAQVALLSEVYQRFQINPETISMVEANATGTLLGDTIEVQALTEVFKKFTKKPQYCALGSIENNLGHSFPSSGMAHVIKVLLALRHNEIPATINIETTNPALDLKNSPFFINHQNVPWNADHGQIRRAAVNSFGATGTNVHLVIADAPILAPVTNHLPGLDKPVLIVLSAKTKIALNQRCRDLKEFLETLQYPSLSQLSANLLVRRSHFPERCAMVVVTRNELHDQLSLLIKGAEPVDIYIGSVHKNTDLSLHTLAQTTIQTIIKEKRATKEELLMLADLYVQGVNFDLSDYFSDAEKFPLSLPTYPFEKRRCWITTAEEAASSAQEESNILVEQEVLEKISLSILVTIQQEVIKITGYQFNEVDMDTHFSRFGLDSLMSMRLLAAVNEKFSLDLHLVDLLEHNTINRLAALIEEERTDNRNHSKETVTRLPIEEFSQQVGWFYSRLSQLPGDLQVVTIERESTIQESSLESAKPVLAELIQKGIAIFNEATRCYLLSHRSIDIQAIVDTFSLEQRNLITKLPTATLIAPISQEQQRNLYHSEVMKQSAWNIYHIYKLMINSLDLSLFNEAMAQIIRQHDLLRTYYLPLGNFWTQIIVPETKLEFQLLDMPSLADFQKFIATQRNRLLDISTPPLLQAWISQIDEVYYLGFVTHHSHADAFTTTMLFAELMNCYYTLLDQQNPSLQPVGEQYWQYALRQFDRNVYCASQPLQYWKEQLVDIFLPMRLPYANDPEKVVAEQLQIAERDIFSLSSSLSEDIGRFNQDYEITYTQLFTTAIAILLTHGMDNSYAIIHFINNQRDRISLINTLGEFTNLLFLPLAVDAEVSLIQVLQEIKRKSLKGLRYAKIDFSELLAFTGLNNYENYYQQLGDVIIDSVDIDAGTLSFSTKYGSSLYPEMLLRQTEFSQDQALGTLFYQILKIDQRIHLITSYRKHLFNRTEMQQLSALIVQIVEEIIHNPKQNVNVLLAKMENKIAMLQSQVERYTLRVDKAIKPEEQSVIEALEKLKDGLMSLEEVENLLDNIVQASQASPYMP
ncbi:MAG: beta-ketoacyl synthase N-terminal-like domain-containing protein [Acidobacteriota bacterium]